MINKTLGIVLIALACFASAAKAQQLTDANATAETATLYQNLLAIQGKRILFGHQDDTVYGIGWKYVDGASDVRKVSGDYPVVYGWEIGHLERGDSSSIDAVSFSKMRVLIQEAFGRGGINTISWHPRNPLTGGSSWDVSSEEVVRSILPGGKKHALYEKWLDNLALFFNSLRTSGGLPIPILFRPFHEHTGNWFWWGKANCTQEDYVRLYRFTVSYLRDKKQVHNLIYIYSPDYVDSVNAYLERYPGDAYVDVLGQDLYHRGGDHTAEKYVSDVKHILSFLETEGRKRCKPFVLSETGADQLPMKDWFTTVLYQAISDHKPVYALVWRNAYENPNHFYAPFPGHPAVDDFIKFKDLEDIFFGADLLNPYFRLQNY